MVHDSETADQIEQHEPLSYILGFIVHSQFILADLHPTVCGLGSDDDN